MEYWSRGGMSTGKDQTQARHPTKVASLSVESRGVSDEWQGAKESDQVISNQTGKSVEDRVPREKPSGDTSTKNRKIFNIQKDAQ